MWRLLVVLFTGAAVQCRYLDNPDAEGFYGAYELVYTWPELEAPAARCSQVVYSRANSSFELPLTCQCGRKSPNFAVILQELGPLKYVLLAEIVGTAEELAAALADECSCSPLDKPRDVLLRVNGSYFLQYETAGERRVYLFGKSAPRRDELAAVLQQLPDLKSGAGSSVCKQL